MLCGPHSQNTLHLVIQGHTNPDLLSIFALTPRDAALSSAVQDRVAGPDFTQRAEAVGFEPTVPFGTAIFKTAALSLSATLP